MEKKETLKAEYFADVYAANDDPWNFETSPYEDQKYSATLQALPKNQYRNALEIGCSIGVLTKMLAEKCLNLLATDISEKALDSAKIRCKDLENVNFQLLHFPDELPNDQFNLILISEVAYYLSAEDWKKAIHKIFDLLPAKGEIVLVHWLPIVLDYPQTGDEVHDTFEKEMESKMENVFKTRTDQYRIDVWRKF
ncbi:class I SAM-dependent DNA methyltransferase [Kaistella polysaccharea]|uniref:class I SAM-dependent DNA methyltransferase n=1 Tax=Kaistella polysaccharea TaxID=2878534 RepID=UPI001CF540EA|nr:SAM-dependent methyltransferase [Kaistella polysaccharea]